MICNNDWGRQMLNEERVKHMTRMAMVEEKENRKLRPVLYYSKKDYLSLCTIGGVFAGTLVYGILYVGAVAILFGTFFVNLSLVGLILGILLGLVLYVLYLYYYLRSVRRRARKRYDEGAALVRQLRRDYRILNEMYQKEDLSKTPEGWD